MTPMTPLQIRTEVEALHRATKPDQRTSYERAFLALAAMVDQATAAIDPVARRLMTAKQLDLMSDLRSAVPHAADRPDPQDEIKRLHQLLRDLVDFDVGLPPELDQLDAEYGSRQLERMQKAWDAAIAAVGPRNQSRHETGDAP